ncbi:MAG: 16S rRNA (guanine(527)-N(7))-methyltransferase RsmG, partial [Muribaculaceae bacterium]|nr:16S rRNA (guanine(527)-N(7))-methyltransferase RsmG [Muribaculaceae bacterium]
VTFQHGDSGECHEMFDFVVSRAVMPQPELVKLSRKNISKEQRNALPNGVIALKGGDLSAELKGMKTSETVDISNYFSEPFFETKKIVYTPVS